MTALQKNCAACDRLITVRLADHKRGWGRFCDKACAAAYKLGQRPRDVNARHAKKSIWAADAMKVRELAGITEWPKAPSVSDQIGHRVNVKPISRPSYPLHDGRSPMKHKVCAVCEEPAVNGLHSITGIEWLCEEHMIDDFHPFSSEAIGQ